MPGQPLLDQGEAHVRVAHEHAAHDSPLAVVVADLDPNRLGVHEG
jgi:hypothetical protein